MSRVPLRLLLAVAPVLVLLVAPAPSRAADCTNPSVATLARRADGVFRGNVTKVGPVVLRHQQRVKHIRMTVTEVFKSSDSPATMRVEAPAARRVRRGDTFLFVTKAASGWQLVCGGILRATAAMESQLTAQLGAGTTLKPAPPVVPPATRAPTFTKVETDAPSRFRQMAAPGAALVLVGILGLLLVRRRTGTA